MTSRLKRHVPLILVLAKAHPTICKAILRSADRNLLQCLTESVLNILKGNVKLKPSYKARLTKYHQNLRKVADNRVSLKEKQKIVQTGGFVPALLAPLLAPLIAPLAEGALSGLLGGKIQNHGKNNAFDWSQDDDATGDDSTCESHSPFHYHLGWWQENCPGQTWSHRPRKSKKIQPNTATISGISGPSAYSIPIKGIPKYEGRWRRNHQNSSPQIPKESRPYLEANSACTQHELEWARRIHPQWRSQRQQHSSLGERCSETSKGISPTPMAGICLGPSPRQCITRLDWKPQTLGLDALRISHIRCLFHGIPQGDWVILGNRAPPNAEVCQWKWSSKNQQV